MTDRELKKNLKKLGMVVVLILLIIGGMAFYTLIDQKAELSIYTNVGYVDNLQALGIEENEFKEYLAVFGNLMDNEYNENQRLLNMATHFMENLYSSYEVQTDENGFKSYDADRIKDIAKEVTGTYIKENIEEGEIYLYNKEKNAYMQNQVINRITYCTEIKEITKQDDKIEVIYELAIMTKEQLVEYQTGQAVEFETRTIKAFVMNNRDYEYSKYFVSEIEEI